MGKRKIICNSSTIIGKQFEVVIMCDGCKLLIYWYINN